MSEALRKEVVLVTGGSGFLGRHIVKHLLNEDNDDDGCAREIRILDKVIRNEIKNDQILSCTRNPNGDYSTNVINKSLYESTTSTGRIEAKKKLLVSFEADLCEIEKCRTALRGVDVVIHCAALVSYDFPPDKKSLDRNNVEATDNLIKLCIEENVTCFINCSTTEVTLKPCVTGGIIAMAVYAQESRSQPPDKENKLIFGEYAASKLRAERIVLDANGTRLKNGGILRTVSLRPPLLYGEGDKNIVSGILYAAKSRGNSLTKIAGLGGKQEIAYVGNAAWAFVCAKNTILHYPDSIAGLPIFINDDTTVENIFRFCERLTRNTKHHITLSGFIPIPISYSFAWLVEIAIIWFPFLMGEKKKFPISPRSMIAYLGSMILHNRSRASIYLNYSPIFNREEALKLSSDYYSKIFVRKEEKKNKYYESILIQEKKKKKRKDF